MKATFTCKTEELLSVLKRMRPGLSLTNKAGIKKICEITVLTGRIRLVLPGIEYYVECSSSSGSCKVALSYIYFFQIVKDYAKPEFEVLIEPNSFQWNRTNTIEVKTTFFENDNILRSIDMSMNPTPVEILKQETKYTFEELDFNNLVDNIRKTKLDVENDLKQSLKYLKKYGITYDELKVLVEKNLSK